MTNRQRRETNRKELAEKRSAAKKRIALYPRVSTTCRVGEEAVCVATNEQPIVQLSGEQTYAEGRAVAGGDVTEIGGA